MPLSRAPVLRLELFARHLRLLHLDCAQLRLLHLDLSQDCATRDCSHVRVVRRRQEAREEGHQYATQCRQPLKLAHTRVPPALLLLLLLQRNGVRKADLRLERKLHKPMHKLRHKRALHRRRLLSCPSQQCPPLGALCLPPGGPARRHTTAW